MLYTLGMTVWLEDYAVDGNTRTVAFVFTRRFDRLALPAEDSIRPLASQNCLAARRMAEWQIRAVRRLPKHAASLSA